MPPPEDAILELVGRIGDLERKLSDLAVHIGHDGPRPADPHKASRWDMPLYWHVSDLRDSLHALANASQILIGLIEQLGPKLDRYGHVSSANSEAIARLTQISARIEENIGIITHEKPLLMRDLSRVDTNAIEVLLFVVVAGQSMMFFSANEALVGSGMFRAMASVSPIPVFWGAGCALLFVGSIISFITRSRKLRTIAAFANAFYFGVTGLVIMFKEPGVLGWLFHIALFSAAFWVFARGPSRAT